MFPNETKLELPEALVRMEHLEREKSAIYDNRKYITDFGLYSNLNDTDKIEQMVALVSQNKMPWPIEEKYEVNHTFASTTHIAVQQTDIFTRANTTLVVAPPTEISRWVQKFTEEKELAVAKVITKNIAENIDINDYDVIVICPKFYNLLSRRYHNTAWKRFIYDHPPHVKIPSMAPITAGFSWYLTCYHELLQDVYRSSRASFMQGISYSYRYYNLFTVRVKEPVTAPVPIIRDYPCRDVHTHNMNLVTLLQEKNFRALTKIFRGRFSTDPVKDIYAYKNGLLQMSGANNEEETRIISMQMDTVETRLKDYAERDCPICHETVKNPVIEITCMNVFCAECLYTWLVTNNQCPYCKKFNCLGSLMYVCEEKEDKTPIRLKRIVEIIKGPAKRLEKRRFAIYSEIPLAMSLKSYLPTNMKIEEIVRDHQTEKIEKKLQKFYSGAANILIFNYSNCYIDLSSVTDLILYGDTNAHHHNILYPRLLQGSSQVARKTVHNFVPALA